MKKRILLVCSALLIVGLIIAGLLAFFMKQSGHKNSVNSDQEAYDINYIVDSIGFMKLNTYEDIKKYSEDYPIYVQKTSDSTMFVVNELYIDNSYVDVIYKCNEDGDIYRFDGKFSLKLDRPKAEDVWNIVYYTNRVAAKYFGVEFFQHSLYGEDGAAIEDNEQAYENMLNGKVKYNISIIDENDTYWNISAMVKDKKSVEFEFFRCFDSNIYDDDSPNIDLRSIEDTGE